ncbi:MAG: HAD-IIIA family hydrolase [Candidatus Hadarchaeum sp.]|uniref:HAD family hydrolase n=1 Tax=Candidatus Hadarchaeum sp. TaxID=2883567 RepID=UPI0031729A7C
MIVGIKAVLFDLDETLIDDLPGLKKCHRAVAKKLRDFLLKRGVEADEEELFQQITKLDDKMNFERKYIRNDWWPMLLEKMGLKVELPRELLEELTQTYWKTFAENSRPYPDAGPTLEYLRSRGYRLGMVTDTDGTKGIKEMRLKQFNFMDKFDVIIISGEDTPKTKPDPGPFLIAAERLGVRPDECVFVGDKPFTDIEGGKVAGMKTILVKRRDWQVVERADFTVRNLAELRRLL